MSAAPEHGARFELAREEGGASYAITVIERDERFEARAVIEPTAIALRWTREPPRWIAETTIGFLKTLRKNHAADSSWPSRLVRWRTEREQA
jgi:hypothetical protein